MKRNQTSSTITVMYDGKFWIALFERSDIEGYSVAKLIIGSSEPGQGEIDEFLKNLKPEDLQFTKPSQVTEKPIKLSWKKQQKIAKKNIDTTKMKYVYTKADALLKTQRDENKIERKIVNKVKKTELEEYKMQILKSKKIDKHKGR
jgi:hypothetical protein